MILLFSGLAAAGCKNIFPLDCWELVSPGDPVHSSNWFPLKPLQGIIFAIWQLPKTSRGWINKLMTKHVDCTCLHYHCDLKYLITSIALTIATIMKQTKPTGMMYDVWHVFLDQVKLIDALATFTIGPSWAMIASQLMGSSLTWCTHDHTWRPVADGNFNMVCNGIHAAQIVRKFDTKIPSAPRSNTRRFWSFNWCKQAGFGRLDVRHCQRSGTIPTSEWWPADHSLPRFSRRKRHETSGLNSTFCD